MLEHLKKKWNVNGSRLLLILCVFAMSGSLTAYLVRSVTVRLEVSSSSSTYWVIKALILVVGYQCIILIISLIFGQFRFFWNFEKKMFRRIAVFFHNKNKKNTPDPKMIVTLFSLCDLAVVVLNYA